MGKNANSQTYKVKQASTGDEKVVGKKELNAYLSRGFHVVDSDVKEAKAVVKAVKKEDKKEATDGKKSN